MSLTFVDAGIAVVRYRLAFTLGTKCSLAAELPADNMQLVGHIASADRVVCKRTGCHIRGPVIYALVVDARVMKIGISGTKKSQLRDRMYGTANEITKTIRYGTDRSEAFKKYRQSPEFSQARDTRSGRNLMRSMASSLKKLG